MRRAKCSSASSRAKGLPTKETPFPVVKALFQARVAVGPRRHLAIAAIDPAKHEAAALVVHPMIALYAHRCSLLSYAKQNYNLRIHERVRKRRY